MPGPYREESIYVAPYDRENGTHVAGHESYALVGTPEFVVLYRPKNVRLAGGTREAPRNRHARWHIKGRYESDAEAERVRRRLLRQGYHAIIERIGGRSEMPSLRELVEDANRSDRERSLMRE